MKAWIRVIDERGADASLKQIYDGVREKRGSVSNVMMVHSLDPQSIRFHMDLYLHLMFGKSTLSRQEREMIAVVVSHLNKCDYCITHHNEALLAHVKNQEFLNDLGNLNFASLSRKSQAMLEYVSKLTRAPSEIQSQNVDKLRAVGFSDEEILRINLITSYFNFVNRIVSGLGVELEDKGERVYNY